ncbi:MAG: CBS and ACT domain-containing protein [Deltaproteobacteria bacterium]|nr:CBS and ACT domain-containing protein [Deltaproteobacteria bacterium]
MKVKNWMTQNPITVKPSTLVMEAAKLMKENKIRRLPVVDRGRVVGIVTHRNILEASPSAATSLSVHELNYILANLKVEEVMRRNPICVHPDDLVMDVVRMGEEKGIGAFPVVDERGVLVGIATETEMYRAFVQLFGTRETDTLIELENVRLRENIGAMSQMAKLAEELNVPVVGIFSLPHRRRPGNRVYMRVQTKEPGPVVAALKEAGFQVAE